MNTNGQKSRFDGLAVALISGIFLSGLGLFAWILHTTHQLSGDVRSINEERAANSQKQKSDTDSLKARLDKIEHSNAPFVDLDAIKSTLDGMKVRVVALESLPRSATNSAQFELELKRLEARIDAIDSSITHLRSQSTETASPPREDELDINFRPAKLTQTIDNITINVTEISRSSSTLIIHFEMLSPLQTIHANSQPKFSGVIAQDSSEYLASSILLGREDQRVSTLRLAKGAKVVGEMRIDSFPKSISKIVKMAIVFDNLRYNWEQVDLPPES